MASWLKHESIKGLSLPCQWVVPAMHLSSLNCHCSSPLLYQRDALWFSGYSRKCNRVWQRPSSVHTVRYARQTPGSINRSKTVDRGCTCPRSTWERPLVNNTHTGTSTVHSASFFLQLPIRIEGPGNTLQKTCQDYLLCPVPSQSSNHASIVKLQ